MSSKVNGNRFDLNVKLFVINLTVMRICCLIGDQHARCEDNGVSIPFPNNQEVR